MNDSDTNAIKKAKRRKKFVKKEHWSFMIIKRCLLNNEAILKSQQRLKHIMYILKKLTRLHEAAMMIRDYKILIKSYHILIVCKTDSK